MKPSRSLILCCLVLAACASPTPTSERLPTRAVAEVVLPAVDDATPFAIPAEAYYGQGIGRQRAGDARGALQHLTWAIRRDPRLAPAYVARGSVYLGQGEGERALGDADAALGIEPSADAFLLRGEALRFLGRHQEALAAFDSALELNPALRDGTFNSRWLAARAAGDPARLAALGEEYAAGHPDDPLRHYYQSWALIESGATMEAVRLLVDGIRGAAQAPALLWYALGRAYAGEEAWPQAVRAFETARALLEAGDASLGLHAEQPVADLFIALGKAYLGAGRCTDAATMLAYAGSIGAPASSYMPALQEAQLCPTPTPRATEAPPG
jgi:tetratricopeptide (TPR) repeat protein